MEAEERPAKMQKVKHISSNVETDPVMDMKHKEIERTVPGNTEEEPNENHIDQFSDENDLTGKAMNGERQKRERSPLPDGMTRSAYKKLKKQQEWEAGRLERRAKKKEKDKTKKQEQRAARAAAVAKGELPAESPKQTKIPAIQVPVTFIIDCDFDDLMFEVEIKSMASQITRCYSDNSRSQCKAHLAVSSFGSRLKERFDGPLEKQYEAWKGMKFFSEDFVEVSKRAIEWMSDTERGGKLDGALLKTDNGHDEQHPAMETGGEVIYLSAESDNTITELKPYSTYIIGGLVDRNRHKGICYKRATEKGIKTAKLPIGDFLEMSSRFVLTTNHVNEIMLKWLEVGDWGEAFMKVIPKRKGGALKGLVTSSKLGDDESGEAKDSDQIEYDEETNGGVPLDQAENRAEETALAKDDNKVIPSG